MIFLRSPVILLLATVVLLASGVANFANRLEIKKLRSQLSAVQPRPDGGIIFVLPEQSDDTIGLDRVVWTGENGQGHIWACGEVFDGSLVSTSRTGEPLGSIVAIRD